jgi:hypothetical protein
VEEIILILRLIAQFITLLLINDLVLQLKLKLPSLKWLIGLIIVLIIPLLFLPFATVFSCMDYFIVILFIVCQIKRKIFLSLIIDLFRICAIGAVSIVLFSTVRHFNSGNLTFIIQLSEAIVLGILGLLTLLFRKRIQKFFLKFELSKIHWKYLALFYLIEWVFTIQTLLLVAMIDYKKWLAVVCGGIIFIVMGGFLLLFAQKEVHYRAVITQQGEKQQLELFIMQQENYYQNLLDKHMEQRKLRHDLRFYMTTIQQDLINKKYDKAVMSINTMLQVDSSKDFYFSGHPLVDVLIYNALSIYPEHFIRLKYQGETISIPDSFGKLDFSLLIGNLVTNAIEANLKCPAAKRYLKMKVARKSEALLIVLSNPTAEKLDMAHDVLKTTKSKKGHGLGTQIIFDMIKKNNADISYSVTDHQFQAKMTIPL